MSFLDSITDVGSSAWTSLTGPGVAGGVARAGILAVMLREVQNSINKDNQQSDEVKSDIPNFGVREQVDPNTENAIPVVYGEAFVGGRIIDAVLTNDNQTMWYCLALCETTGIKLSDNQQSQITFEQIYWNQNRIILQNDGITAASFEDEDGNSSDSINGLIKFYLYNNGSNSPTKLGGYANGALSTAYSYFPNWTGNHTLDNTVFCLVRVDYSAEKQVTGLGRMEFKIKNTMTQPGDCLYDYMTNTRYGAGIQAEEIRAQ